MITRKKEAVPVGDAMPSEGEEIEIYFEMPCDQLKWWPSTVEEVHPPDGEQGVVACGTVTFHAVYYHVADRARIVFEDNRVVRTRSVVWTECSCKMPEEKRE